MIKRGSRKTRPNPNTGSSHIDIDKMKKEQEQRPSLPERVTEMFRKLGIQKPGKP